jgi:hypothetical protein
MARGTVAKEKIEAKIKEAFGVDFLGISDKKIYLQAEENGEQVQVAITMTCPKVPYNGAASDNAFDAVGANTQPTEFKPAEVTNEETEKIKKLLAELGL